jgi:hypothetical protein
MIFLNKIIKKGNKSKIILAAAAAAAAAVGINMSYFCHQIRVGSSIFDGIASGLLKHHHLKILSLG